MLHGNISLLSILIKSVKIKHVTTKTWYILIDRVWMKVSEKAGHFKPKKMIPKTFALKEINAHVFFPSKIRLQIFRNQRATWLGHTS